MQNVRQMTDDELRQTVQTMASGFAAEDYRRQHPSAAEADAWAWAARNWREFRDRALDALALVAAEQEAGNAAAGN